MAKKTIRKTVSRTKPREQTVEQARDLVSDDLLIEFFRTVRPDNEVLAVRLINEHLDKGRTLDEILLDNAGYGFLLSVERLSDAAFRISFGCQAGPLAGDGGVWNVAFDDRGNVSSLSGGLTWIS